jgi:hypothetical protein
MQPFRMLFSRGATIVLALWLAAMALVWHRYAPLLGEGSRTWFAAGALLIGALYLLRLILRMRRHPASYRPLTRPPLRWDLLDRFDPADAGARRGTGYIGFTESFSATGTVQAYLEALSGEKTRMATCAFAFAYLGERMGSPASAILDPDGPQRPPAQPLSAENILGWLAAIHRDYPNNAPADSSFVQYALHDAAQNFADGRSLALQKAWRELSIVTLREIQDFKARQARLDAHRALSDLDPDTCRQLLRWCAAQGRALGRLHGSRVPNLA